MADRKRVFISGMGIISPMGLGVDATLKALQNAATGIRPLTLFPCPFETPLPVGEVVDLPRWRWTCRGPTNWRWWRSRKP